MRVSRLALLLTLASGCWPDFPQNRFLLDASPGETPGGPRDLAAEQPPRDAIFPLDVLRPEGPRPADQGPDLVAWCTPGQGVACEDANTLLSCNTTGDGMVATPCGPLGCNSVELHCDECEIGSASRCEQGSEVSCSTEGLLVTTPCPVYCKNGRCCAEKDDDKDSTTDCDGDCNDDDPRVHPDQEEFFDTASNGSFDYDCDGKERPKHRRGVDCEGAGKDCKTGSGWTGAAPPCGQPGSFVHCTRRDGACVQQQPVTEIQHCR